MNEPDAPLTWINPDELLVELPVCISLEWFDNMRKGVVGVITLIPNGLGAWTFTFSHPQGMIDQAVETVRRCQQEEEGDGGG